jgi:ribosome-binding factor A
MSRSSPKFHAPTHRLERVGELIRHAISESFTRGDVPDDVLERQPVTVAAVRMTPDLKVAVISVMPLGGRDAAATIDALNRHKKEFRTLIAHKINLRFAPELRFALDSSFEAQAHIDALLRSPEVARDLESRDSEPRDLEPGDAAAGDEP